MRPLLVQGGTVNDVAIYTAPYIRSCIESMTNVSIEGRYHGAGGSE